MQFLKVGTSAQEALQRAEVKQLAAIVFAGSAVAAIASTYIVTHIDEKKDVRREVYAAIGLSFLTTTASLAYTVWSADRAVSRRSS
jgi:hypothetical protein